MIYKKIIKFLDGSSLFLETVGRTGFIDLVGMERNGIIRHPCILFGCTKPTKSGCNIDWVRLLALQVLPRPGVGKKFRFNK